MFCLHVNLLQKNTTGTRTCPKQAALGGLLEYRGWANITWKGPFSPQTYCGSWIDVFLYITQGISGTEMLKILIYQHQKWGFYLRDDYYQIHTAKILLLLSSYMLKQVITAHLPAMFCKSNGVDVIGQSTSFVSCWFYSLQMTSWIPFVQFDLLKIQIIYTFVAGCVTKCLMMWVLLAKSQCAVGGYTVFLSLFCCVWGFFPL